MTVNVALTLLVGSLGPSIEIDGSVKSAVQSYVAEPELPALSVHVTVKVLSPSDTPV